MPDAPFMILVACLEVPFACHPLGGCPESPAPLYTCVHDWSKALTSMYKAWRQSSHPLMLYGQRDVGPLYTPATPQVNFVF